MTKAPGKSHRKGLTLIQLGEMFPDDAAAEAWFAKARWPDGPYCPHCGSKNVQSNIKHRTMTHRCRDCPDKRMFSLKTGTVMEGSKLGYRVWAIAVYLVTTNLKGVSSMKLHRDLGVTQKTAWHLAHRIRKSLELPEAPFSGPVETDETYVGGKLKNMHAKKRREARQRPDYGKTIVAGARDRATGTVRGQKIEYADKETLHAFVGANAAPGAAIYTDEARAYQSLPNHETVNHSRGEYVRDDGVSTNGLESFWSMLKRGYHGTYHHWSPKHTDRYVAEFTGRHNDRDADTIVQMEHIAAGMAGKRLMYRDLIA